MKFIGKYWSKILPIYRDELVSAFRLDLALCFSDNRVKIQSLWFSVGSLLVDFTISHSSIMSSVAARHRVEQYSFNKLWKFYDDAKGHLRLLNKYRKSGK